MFGNYVQHSWHALNSRLMLLGCPHAQVGTMEAGKFQAVLSSDDLEFGGQGRINSATEHFTHPEGTPGLLQR